MRKSKARVLGEGEYSLWDSFVEKSPYGTVFHKSCWLKAIDADKDFKLEIIGVFKNNELIGGCAFHVKNFLFWKIAYSPLSISGVYGGVIFKDAENGNVRKREHFHNEIIKKILFQISKRSNYCVVCNGPRLKDVRAFKWFGWKADVSYTYLIDLKRYSGKRQFLESISNSARRAIKNAEKNKIVIKKELNSEIVYKLHKETFLYHGLDSRPRKFFESVYMQLGKTIKAHQYNAYKDKILLSTMVFIEDKNNFYYWTGGSVKDSNLFNSPSLIVFRAVLDFLASNKKFDFSGCTKEHIADFESAFNPELVSYYYVYKMNILTKALNLFHNNYQNK